MQTLLAVDYYQSKARHSPHEVTYLLCLHIKNAFTIKTPNKHLSQYCFVILYSLLASCQYSLCILESSFPYEHFCYTRNTGSVTLKISYFHYLKKYFLHQSIRKIINLILKPEALFYTFFRTCCHISSQRKVCGSGYMQLCIGIGMF